MNLQVSIFMLLRWSADAGQSADIPADIPADFPADISADISADKSADMLSWDRSKIDRVLK